MIVLKRPSKTPHYCIGVVCTLYFAFVLGCAPDVPQCGEGDTAHSAGLSGRKSADVRKKEVGVSDTKAHEKQVSSPISKNVSSSLRAMIENMETLGITKENAKELKASSLSTPLVRVNDEGNIQTYVHVISFGVDEKALLDTRDVVIEIVNEELGIIQAWIPFDKVYEIAELPFVERITQPSYSTP